VAQKAASLAMEAIGNMHQGRASVLVGLHVASN